MGLDLLRQTRDYFKAQNIPEVDASILLEHLLACSRSEVQLKLLRMSDDEVKEIDRNLRRLVLRRQNGEPVQYITGSAPFRYLEYEVGPGVLIPRPETELLVESVLDRFPKDTPLRIADVGTGSGAIAIALAAHLPQASFTAPYQVSGTATEYVRAGDQGARFRFRFCPVCGTTVFHTEEGTEGRISVAVGAFADPGFPPPRLSIYDSRRHPWVTLPVGTRAFPRDPD